MSTTCLHSYISIYSKLTLVIYTLWIKSKRPITMSVSLHTQTGLHCLTIQVLNTRVCFIDIWYTSLTSVHYNLEHGLVNVTESFSPLNLNYTASLVKVQIRSDTKSHAISNTTHLSCTTTSKNQFELVTACLNHVLSMRKDSTPQPLLEFPIFLPDGL